MRFAVSLLTVLAIASIIGTVLKQNEPYNNYLNQFGQFWFPLFERLGLYSVYHASWFLLILVFLVVSTSLCIIRQAPGMVREMKSYRAQAREASLRLFAHHHSTQTKQSIVTAAESSSKYLSLKGYRFKTAEQNDGGLLLAAKAGSWNRMGYLLAHGAIVMICIGGLLDGDMPLQMQMWLGNKQLTQLDKPFSEIGPESRLGADHHSYRGNLFLPEGKRGNIAVLNVKDGVLLQELPFTVTLNKFVIDYYSTGMPKRFASDIVLTDHATGQEVKQVIEVNKPLIHKGIALYQASFEDGGSRLQFRAHPLQGGAVPSTLQVEVGSAVEWGKGDQMRRLEVTAFRPINVENMATPTASEQNTLAMLNRSLGSAAGKTDKQLQNVGPSFSYKVRDSAGQAREYNNYMLPVEQDGRRFFMTGMRESGADGFRYLRVPADEDGTPATWLTMRQMLLDPAQHAAIARRFAAGAMKGDAVSDTMRSRLAATAERTLQLYSEHGFDSLGKYINENVPEAEREKAADVFVRVLQGCAWEAWRLMRERQKLVALEPNEARGEFVRDAVNAISDAFFYGAPFFLELTGFEEVKASVIQVTRSPGQVYVYLGCALLVAGVFFMLYVRERRLFVLFKPSGEVLLAMSSNRKTLDNDAEFAGHVQAIDTLLNNRPTSDEYLRTH